MQNTKTDKAKEFANRIITADEKYFEERMREREREPGYDYAKQLLPFLGPKKRGPKKETNWYRDYGIAHAVWLLGQEPWNFKLYRNRKQKNRRESCCSIVGRVLPGIGETGIEAVNRRVLKFLLKRTGRLHPKN